MLKNLLQDDLKRVIKGLGFELTTDIVVSIPENANFGDYSTNIPLQLANQKFRNDYQTPLEIANAILEKLGHPAYIEQSAVVSPGFLNFFVKKATLAKNLIEILTAGNAFGKNNSGANKKIQVEFISANPTGPLTLANGRGGAIGDTLANIFTASGFRVEREYYLNDTGNQIRTLAESVQAQAGRIDKKEHHYQGEYIKDLAQKFNKHLSLDPQELGHALADHLLKEEIQNSIKEFGVKFDEFYSERSLYPDKITHAALTLEQKGYAYKKDGALYFSSTKFGDSEDRVLLTSQTGRGRVEPTYFLADIAHHLDVLERGYEYRVNILGADHHSYAQRITYAMEALGYKNKAKIILIQFVKLIKAGVEVKMSKRAGTYVPLSELISLVGKDVARFFFLMYSPNSHINFNLDKAQEKSNNNPLFYVQYAHARMSGIIGKSGLKIDNPKLELLTEQAESDLIKHLCILPDLVFSISKDFQVQKLTEYSIKLADLFHKFYEEHSVLGAGSEDLVRARLSLVKSAKITLRNTLNLMGIEAPEKM